MSAENCEFRKKPCPGVVKTSEDEGSTWETIRRLKGVSDRPISPAGHSCEFRFKDTEDKIIPLKNIAQRYSEDTIFGIIPRASCGTCTKGIQEVVDHIYETPASQSKQ